MPPRQHKRRRPSRLAAVIAAYALVLQAFFAGAAQARVAVPPDLALASHILCLGAGGSDSGVPGHSDETIHCGLCALSVQLRGLDDAPDILPVAYADARILVWSFHRDQHPAALASFQQRSRGPPTA
jgi:hypothetical protein